MSQIDAARLPDWSTRAIINAAFPPVFLNNDGPIAPVLGRFCPLAGLDGNLQPPTESPNMNSEAKTDAARAAAGDCITSQAQPAATPFDADVGRPLTGPEIFRSSMAALINTELQRTKRWQANAFEQASEATRYVAAIEKLKAAVVASSDVTPVTHDILHLLAVGIAPGVLSYRAERLDCAIKITARLNEAG